MMSSNFIFGKTETERVPEELRYARVLRNVGYKINRAHMTIRPSVPVYELSIDERAALDALKNKYHFLVLPAEED